MSEKLFKFLLSELNTVRVHCRNCDAIIEIPFDKIGSTFPSCACPLCRHTFDTGTWESGHLFQILAEAFRRIKAIKERVEVEFVLPDRNEE